MIFHFSMNIKKRDQRIKDSSLSIQELSDKYGISYERIRQIVRNDRGRQLKRFVSVGIEYKKNVCSIIESDLNKEIHRILSKGRNKIIIIQKVILIKTLKDKYKMSLYRIAKLFGNNYGTIAHLYKSSKLK